MWAFFVVLPKHCILKISRLDLIGNNTESPCVFCFVLGHKQNSVCVCSFFYLSLYSWWDSIFVYSHFFLFCPVNNQRFFALARHRALKLTGLIHDASSTAIHKKHIKFKFCWNFFLVHIYLFNSHYFSSFLLHTLDRGPAYSHCETSAFFYSIICGSAWNERHRTASNCCWCRSFMRTNIISIHSIELCSWLPEKILPLNFRV